jgi:Delta6-protoilludene synthase
MNELEIGVQDALDWVGRLSDNLIDRFLADYENLPSFSDESETVNRETVEFADSLGNIVRAIDQWSFEVWGFIWSKL